MPIEEQRNYRLGKKRSKKIRVVQDGRTLQLLKGEMENLLLWVDLKKERVGGGGPKTSRNGPWGGPSTRNCSSGGGKQNRKSGQRY